MAKYFNQTFAGRRPSTYQTPPSNMSQRYTPSYGMSSGPVAAPSWARSSGNSISAYNPRGVNRAYNAPRSMSRAPVLDMKTDGTFKIMNYGTGKSLPGYKGPIRGLPGTGIGMGKIMTAFGRMVGFSRRLEVRRTFSFVGNLLSLSFVDPPYRDWESQYWLRLPLTR